MNKRTLGWLLIFVSIVAAYFGGGLLIGGTETVYYGAGVTSHENKYGGIAIVLIIIAICALVCGISVLRKNPKN